MNVRRALATGVLVLAAASVAAVPAAASAAPAPVTPRGDGWTQAGTFEDPMQCASQGAEGVANAQWALYECASNDEGGWDLWVTEAPSEG